MTLPVPDIPPGVYRGTVEGAESGRCDARIEVARVPGGLAVDYEAFGAAGLQHVEHTLVMSGRLHVAHSESPTVTVMDEGAPGYYLAAADDSPYVLAVVIGWDGGTLTWAWHWAPTGGQPVEQSKAIVRAG